MQIRIFPHPTFMKATELCQWLDSDLRATGRYRLRSRRVTEEMDAGSIALFPFAMSLSEKAW